ncbi:cyanophycinase [Alteromonas flava]|uniref:cyanophycinase n=1 Tax=Alteromonas flava TaxID=2048003 RepID=UPI000F5FFB9D|nr:cyanophycinase [Alteromonas flava]
MSWAFSVVASEEEFDLLLAGGSLTTCSSFAPQNCRVNNFTEDDKQQNLYEFSPAALTRFLQQAQFQSDFQQIFTQVHAILLKGYAESTGRSLSRSQFLDAIVTMGMSNDSIRDLPDPVYFALLDSHEMEQRSATGNRKQERADVLNNANANSIAVYQAFVDQAKLRVRDSNSPRIAVITASSRDPYESADFYLSAFSSLGADVVWLPLDAAYQHALWLQTHGVDGCGQLTKLRAQHNQFDRARIYPLRTAMQVQYCQQPELVSDLLGQVHGVFFNGGDQSKTLAAMLTPKGEPSAMLEIIQQRMLNKELVVGGTSAGTAVQAGGFRFQRPVPMLTNGHSRQALVRGAMPLPAPSQRCLGTCAEQLFSDDLTYLPQGGLGLFTLGLVDTHFSERDREARLLAFTQASAQRFAFGVDETTALTVNYQSEQISLGVIGENGVFVIDRAGSQSFENMTTDFALQQRQLSAITHYLVPGMRLQYSSENNELKLQTVIPQVSERIRMKALVDGVWRNSTREWCGSQKRLSWHQPGYQVTIQASEATRFYVSEKPEYRQCGYFGLPAVLTSS